MPFYAKLTKKEGKGMDMPKHINVDSKMVDDLEKVNSPQTPGFDPTDDELLWVQMYSIRELDLNTLTLRCNPYDADDRTLKDSEKEEALSQVVDLKSLGIVFYRDSEHASAAFLVSPEDGDPFPAYYCQMAFSEKSGRVVQKYIVWKNKECLVNYLHPDQVHRIFT
jgi:hypothetical protein